MDFDNLISFVPLSSTDNDNNQQIITRNLSTLASLAGLSSLNQFTSQQYTLDSFKIEKPINPDLVNIKDFVENFKNVKTKLKEIEDVIQDLEKQKELIKQNYQDVMKKLIEFFGFSESDPILETLKQKAFEMTCKLNLEHYCEEKNKLLDYYQICVPLLNQVKDEFFGDNSPKENCHICYENKISHAIFPCGHTLCDHCKKKISNNCYLCRTPVIKVNKIFI